MRDYIIRATAAGDAIRAFAMVSTETVEAARVAHETSPIVTAALGRSLTAAAMMGVTLKSEKDLMTLQLMGDGPMRSLTVTANYMGQVKGFPNVSVVDLPPKNGKLDVGGAIGVGLLRVIKDMGLKEPYVGTTELITGEIAEDLTYYFATSEQIPSSVGLGVLVNPDMSVMCAGGFIIQLMPFTPDDVIDKLENNIKNIPSVTDMLKSGKTPEEMLETVLAGMDVEVMQRYDNCGYVCDCTSERVERSLISLGEDDVKDIIADGKPIEVRCQFCNKRYEYTVDELVKLRSNRK